MLRKELECQNVSQIKAICKKQKLKGYSKLKKHEIIHLIVSTLAVSRIQKWFRDKIRVNPSCLISLEPITYPFYSKKSKTPRRFYYYNLESIIEYLINIGPDKARDPALDEPYSQKSLDELNELYTHFNLHHKFGFRNLKLALRRKSHYKNRKDIEERVDIYLEMIRKNIQEIVEKVNLYNNEDISTASAFNVIGFKFQQLLYYVRGLYFLNKYWAQKSFEIMYDYLSKIQPDTELKEKCIDLILTEKNNKMYNFSEY